jgi:class 3 adenylate cyclase
LEGAGDEAPAEYRARAQFGRAQALGVLNEHELARDARQRAVELYTETGDHAGISRAHSQLSFRANLLGDLKQARTSVDIAFRHAKLAGDDALIGGALWRLSSHQAADERLATREQAAELLTKARDYRELARAYLSAAYQALLHGRPAEALTLLKVAPPAAEKVQSPETTMFVFGNLGLANLFSGGVRAAREAFESQLRLCLGHAFRYGADEGLAGLAAIFAHEGHAEQAARLLGAARALGYPPALDEPIYDRLESDFIARVRIRRGSAAWARDERAGGALSYDEAIAYGPAASSTGPSGPGGGVAHRHVERAFMFTDIVNSTPLVATLGDEAWADLLHWHDRTLQALFRAQLGDQVDHTGDGFFVAFPDASHALRCAQAIQSKLARHRHENGFAPQVRIGVHTDTAISAAGNYRGHGVHLAARVGAHADGGEILVSRRTLAAAGPGFTAAQPRTVELKGVNEPIELLTLASG